MSSTASRLASIAASALLTLATVTSMNALASDKYCVASNEQLLSTPMASAQQVTITARRLRA
jgi:hypothetical protein